MVAKFENINKIYCTSAGTFNNNETTGVKLNNGEILLINGKSEYSKKTLLTLMGCIINPNEGILSINGKNTNLSGYEEIILIESQTIGFVFHQQNLFEAMNTEENVAFSLRVQKLKSDEIRQRTKEALKTVDMYERRKKIPKQLSKLEIQQTLIAKALVINPKIIICDKPTAFLDRQSGVLIMKMLKELSRQGKAIVILNHDSRFNEFADRGVEVKNGIVNEFSLM
ncbi:MAG: ATP-binding cassette domain-containing protein [Flavobacterium sp.]|uniref:ATP-binding cassette domain-containing protein n=1 Tax=Flavobacterium sp. TaxID=239 RepID=UPI00262A6F6B|nr:ATP-binding cassette domain-containing protein [Flavobacterium sp.]MDD5149235.1 ATP-binding cassette domain-containing protein [Flavobacterium sp.]